jgi:hypothetical protein
MQFVERVAIYELHSSCNKWGNRPLSVQDAIILYYIILYYTLELDDNGQDNDRV